MYNELIDAFLNIPQTRKSSSQTLSTKYNVPLIDVQYIRTLDAENLLIFKTEYNQETLSLQEKQQVIKEHTSNDFLGDLLEQRGIDRDQVVAKSFWAKDAKSKTSTFYSIRCDAKGTEEPLDLDAIRDVLTQQVTPKVLSSVPAGEDTLLLYIADTHLGCLVESDAQFVSGYTKEMFKERVMATLNLVKPNQKVYVTLLGDILDSVKGLTSRGGHHLPGNMTDKEMYVTFIETFKEYFETLSEITPNFAFISCGEDNHTGSQNFIISKSLELYLNTRFPSIETHVFEKFIGHFKLNSNGVEHTIMVCHGKDENKLSRGLPFSLTPPVELKINNYMIHNSIPMNTKQVHFVKGDLHMHGSQYSTNGGFRYRNCGSLAMPSAWIQQQTFGNTTSGVSYDIINGTQVLESNLFFS